MTAETPSATAAGAPCPCGSGVDLDACCGRYLQGLAPPTAATLMRSRYTAYALKNADYLLATWHPSTRPASLDLTGDSTVWQRLTISGSRETDQQAEVSFTADFVSDGKSQTLRETSRFLREDGRWYYLDGEARWERRQLPGRNEPCWCGSGRKFKKCCGQ